MPARGRRPLAAPVRVVDGVHRGAARLRSLALVTVAPRLADRDVLMVGVADRADARARVERDGAHLARGQAQRGALALLGDELDRRAGGAPHLAAAAGRELDVVDRGAGGDRAKRQAVARLDVSAGPGLDGGPDAQPRRREDVALLAVGVVQEGDVRRAVGVVLDCGNARRHAVLAALEVDLAVAALGSAAAVARGLAPARVAAAALAEPLGQRLLGLRARDLAEVGVGGEAAAGAGGLWALERHPLPPISEGGRRGRENRAGQGRRGSV